MSCSCSGLALGEQLREALMVARLKRTKKKREGCEGECHAFGTATKVVKGKCPEDCDDEIIGTVRKAAKKKAKENADKKCEQQSKNCECAGSTYEVVSQG